MLVQGLHKVWFKIIFCNLTDRVVLLLQLFSSLLLRGKKHRQLQDKDHAARFVILDNAFKIGPTGYTIYC